MAASKQLGRVEFLRILMEKKIWEFGIKIKCYCKSLGRLQANVGPVAQSVQRLTTGWTVRDRIPVGTRLSARPDRPWDPPSLLYNGYRVFPGGKVRPGRAADHSPPSSAAVMEQYSYTCTHPLGHTGPVTGSLYLSISKYISRYVVNMHNTLIYFSWSIRIEYGRLSSSSLGVFPQSYQANAGMIHSVSTECFIPNLLCILALTVKQSFDTTALLF